MRHLARRRRPLVPGLLAAASLITVALLAPPAQADGYDDPVLPAPTTPPPAGSVTPEETVLPPKTPDYFEALYPYYLSAPLPAKIYKRGGIPAVVPQLELDNNPNGRLGSYLPDGPVATAKNAFFESLGTNGRSCATCHQPPSGMSISLRNVKARFNKTNGRDPLFAPVDGANCPSAVPAEYTSGALFGGRKGKGRRALRDASSLLLTRGVIRIPMPWPPKDEAGNPKPVEFTIRLVQDAPGCNKDPDYGMGKGFVSVYRRPLIASQLDFKTVRQAGSTASVPILPGSVMWDGRERSLEQQAIDATRGHAQATSDPSPDKVAQIVAFENRIFGAQLVDRGARRLDADGALGGPVNLFRAETDDDGVGGLPPGSPIFNEYDGWATQPGIRASIKRGQDIFNNRPFDIRDVAGSNGLVLSIPGGPTITVPNPFRGTCGTCHATENAGSDFLPDPLRDIGIGGTASGKGGPAPAADLPIFELTCNADAPPHLFLGRGPVLTNDPGKALLTGKCADIGRFSVPQLRGLSSREPYFHDGTAKTLRQVVDFYAARFKFMASSNPADTTEQPLTEQEKQDLVNFLAAL